MNDEQRKAEYVEAVTRGEGFMPWQDRTRTSAREQEFRAWVEERKYALLGSSMQPKRPAIISDDDVERIRRNVRDAEWAQTWFERHRERADYVVERGADWIDAMISATTPTASYSFVCPHCFGRLSHEGGSEGGIVSWNYRNPDFVSCRRCEQSYPSDEYPEDATLAMPRYGQEITYYRNEDERAHPDDRSGRHAYRWGSGTIHPSYTGMVRGFKISFMLSALEPLSLMYRLTGEVEYARAGITVLLTLTDRFGSWLYHDYWDGVADCDPLYAAWHDGSLPIEWKRHLTTNAYKDDTLDGASMLQTYWGAGRVSPSTGGVGAVDGICSAYDLLSDAADSRGAPLWTAEEQTRVERDLILEWAMEAEPYLGGPGHADVTDNKSPRIYAAFATVARVLGVPEFADVALRGYEGIRDTSFGFDGFSHESPAYNGMYLSKLLLVPERLHGFQFPDGSAPMDLYASDPKLFRMMRCMTDVLQPDSTVPPLSDTRVVRSPTSMGGSHILEIAANRFPDYFAENVRAIYQLRDAQPTGYAVTNLDARTFELATPADFVQPDGYFPNWGTAFLRHGIGASASLLTVACNEPGAHRHTDNLSVFYRAGGRVALGDQGYLSAAPIQGWIRDTLSHNLVVVDDAGQLYRDPPRIPRFHRMATSPLASVVELSSRAYEQCSDYRRLVALLNGPVGESVAVDVFRVKGGRKHAWRLFSEFAASDAEGSALVFDGVDMPPEAPIPDHAASQEPGHIFGLLDTRVCEQPPAEWSATWRDAGGEYRLWMLSGVERVEASHGPGQETWTEAGRRVRYVDAINEGDGVESVFVAVHDAVGAVRSAQRISLPREVGPDTVALRLETAWGTYLLFSECADKVEVDGVRFAGAFGVVRTDSDGKRTALTVGATTFDGGGGLGFEGEPAVWESGASRVDDETILADSEPPRGMSDRTDGVTGYVAVEMGGRAVGLPVASVDGRRITVPRFPVPDASHIRLEAVRYASSDT